MIPVITLNDKGEVNGQQAFNDNLTVVEQINRALLATVTCAQTKLINSKYNCEQIIGNSELTASKLATINTAAFTLYTSIMTAISTFDSAVDTAANS